ncbi:MAG: DUF1080 domain-containing protein [Acidobacteriia bacterium]|nr:DUF1080 domain-containing protein [Terriglobia bacterium]MYG01841.1 DUF1080 domain-containing protein [Terriglobia bacterium]MYK10172.1 DUF1080 domain-containing protein [Terriglobia bacterium]
MKRSIAIALFAVLAVATAAENDGHPAPTGYTDTPFLPGDRWRVHDDARPRPRLVEPGTASTQSKPGLPPSDAIVLFDGENLSNWLERKRGETSAPTWKVENGYMEVVPGTGSHITKQKFGDVQLHIEWAAPAEPRGNSQQRGNSGILIMGLYEIQVLDSYDNISYADGQAGAIYGQYPPMVNASRKPGEWQAYDIIFEAPRFAGDKLEKPAFVTVFHNGVLLHHRKQMMGPMRHRTTSEYVPHEAELGVLLQAHGNPVRYRNIWARRLDLRNP